MSGTTMAVVVGAVVVTGVRGVERRAASQQAPIDVGVLLMFGGMSAGAAPGDDRSSRVWRRALTPGLRHVAVSWLKDALRLAGAHLGRHPHRGVP